MIDLQLLKEGNFIITTQNKKAIIVEDLDLKGMQVVFKDDIHNTDVDGTPISWFISDYQYTDGLNLFLIESSDYTMPRSFEFHEFTLVDKTHLKIRIGKNANHVEVSPFTIHKIVDKLYSYFRVSYRNDDGSELTFSLGTNSEVLSAVTIYSEEYQDSPLLNYCTTKLEKFLKRSDFTITKIEYIS